MHPGELAELQTLQTIAERLTAAPHRGRGVIAAEGARLLGVSVQTLYTRLRKVGYASGRKLRSDRGDTRVDPEGMKAVAAILQASRRTTGKQLLPMTDAIDVALANGLLDERVSPQTMHRIMRRAGCHPAQLSQPTPHTAMRSLHPNHVWQLDASICVLYYLRNGRAAIMDERKFNARKPKDLARIANLRVLRYAITDHTTGDVIARYYHTAGEDQQTLFEFLMWSFHKQPDRVMHGVPWMLVWDAGSANQSHGIRNLLTALGIRHWAHVPGNSRAKGQVECVHNIIERKFEGRLTFTRIDSVEQLNAELDTWLRSFNGVAIHRRLQHPRDAVWQTIREDQLRLCPPVADCAVLMHSKPEPRTVSGNLTISFKARHHASAIYSVAHVPEVRVGEKVEVIVNPYRAPAIFVISQGEEGGLRYIECEPIATGDYNFFSASPVFGERYAAHADTDVDSARKEANELAYGERDTLDATAAKAKGKLAFDGRIDPFADLRAKAEQTPAFMQRRGTELHLPNRMHVEVKPFELIDVMLELKARFGRPPTVAEREAVQAWFPEGIPQEELEGVFARLAQLDTAGAPATPQPPRLVAVN